MPLPTISVKIGCFHSVSAYFFIFFLPPRNCNALCIATESMSATGVSLLRVKPSLRLDELISGLIQSAEYIPLSLRYLLSAAHGEEQNFLSLQSIHKDKGNLLACLSLLVASLLLPYGIASTALCMPYPERVMALFFSQQFLYILRSFQSR